MNTQPLAAVFAWLKRRRDARALEALDDRMLHDIGVSRGEIPALVRLAERHRTRR